MRYFNGTFIANQASSRLRDGTFNIQSEYFRGRRLEDGTIEIVDDVSDEAVLRFHPGKFDKAENGYPVSLKFNGEKHTSTFFRRAFDVQALEPTKAADTGIRYASCKTYGYVNGRWQHIDTSFDVKTDGWIHLSPSGKLVSYDTPDEAGIDTVARQAMLKEIKRVRHIIRCRAKFGAFKWDSDEFGWAHRKPASKELLAKVNGDNLNALHRFIACFYTHGYYYSSKAEDNTEKLNERIVACYNSWISTHRRELYREFGVVKTK